MLVQILSVAAVALSLIQFVPYLMTIIKGQTKPSPIAYAIWGSASTITLLNLIILNAGASLIGLQLTTASTTLTIFFFSLKRGKVGTAKIDFLLGSLALVALILLVTGYSSISLFASVSTTAIGYLSTINKLKKHPNTEPSLSWFILGMSALSAIVANLLIGTAFTLMLPPMVTFTGSLIMVAMNRANFPDLRTLFKNIVSKLLSKNKSQASLDEADSHTLFHAPLMVTNLVSKKFL